MSQPLKMRLSSFSLALLRTPLHALSETHADQSSCDSAFEEGLYVSSPLLWKELQKINQASVKEQKKFGLTLSKYQIRSCTRCTPFGTFAGSAIAEIADSPTNLILGDQSAHRRSIRVDMSLIAELIAAIVKIPEIQHQVKFYPNNSLYELPEEYRYAEYTISDGVRSYQLVSVQKTVCLKAILHKALHGATIAEIRDLLVDHAGASMAEATAFIDELCLSQVLFSGLEPTVTGKDPLDSLIDNLELLSNIEPLLQKLKNVRLLITNPKSGVAYYQAVEDALRQLNLLTDLPKNALQVDLFPATRHCCLNRTLVDAISQQAADLLFLSRKATNGELENFKRQFSARYQEMEIPLAIALDADLGIGYAGVFDEHAGGGELIDDLDANRYTSNNLQNDSSYLAALALSKYEDYQKSNKSIIELTEDDLEHLKKFTKEFHFPKGLHLMGSLFRKDGLLDSKHFTFDVASMGGPSAANLLARFAHGDERIYELTREIIRVEEAADPESIYAEIVHLPQARIGNILLRPLLREYEIPYAGRSGIAFEGQILLEDLLVCMRDHDLILRSKKLNRRIIPRLTTAHNFSYKSLPVYKFLCDLQMQGFAYPNAWDWGVLASLKYLPRVAYKNLIIRKATWKISENDIKDLPKDEAEYLPYFKEFIFKHNIPQRAVYAESDNELLIDFAKEKGVELFIHYLKRYKTIQIEEFLFTEANSVVMDVHGNSFTNELIIPLYQTDGSKPQARIVDEQPTTGIKRKFGPGTEWLYFKVYCGSKTAERILAEYILPFVERGISERLFEQFFFIRYRDDFGHFRIRFYNTDVSKQAALQIEFMQILQVLLDNGTVDKIAVDTYNREMERYGPAFMEASESVFFNDSLAVLRFINLLDDAEGNRYRLLFALRGIDILLADFGFSMHDRHDLLKSVRQSFFKEFGGSPALQKQLNEKYRKQQMEIFSHLDEGNDIANEIEEAVAVFKTRSEMNAPIAANMLDYLRYNFKEKSLAELLRSYIHMFMNRMFIAQQRKYELVVYHFLEKYYSSQLAIGKKNASLNSIPDLQPV